MTIVRTKTPPALGEAMESRMLQQADENLVKIIFGVHQGIKAASFIKATWAIVVAGAFLAFAF